MKYIALERRTSSLDHTSVFGRSQFIEVDDVSSKSCTDVCSSDGLICTAKAPLVGFTTVEAGAAWVRYTYGTYRVEQRVKDCNAVPAPSLVSKGMTLTLTKRTCQCADPGASLPAPPK